MRAGSGLLLSAHARSASVSVAGQMDAAEPLQQLRLGRERIHALADAAQQHEAKAPGEPEIRGATREQSQRQLPTEQGLVAVEDSLATTDSRGGDEAGGAGTIAAWGRPDLAAAAPQGVLLTTPASTVAAAGATATVSAGHDINWAVGGGLTTQARKSVTLYTYGKATPGPKPNQEVGIKLHARLGSLSAQSQNGQTLVTAKRRVDLFAIDDVLTIAGAKGVLLAAAGAGIDLKNGAIDLKGPASVLFKASQKIYNPGGGAGHAFTSLPRPPGFELKPTDLHLTYLHSDGDPVQGAPFELTFADGSTRKGMLDAAGSAVVEYVPPGHVKVHYGEDVRKGPVGEDEPNPLRGWMD